LRTAYYVTGDHFAMVARFLFVEQIANLLIDFLRK
jgi:hypothetical protein